MTGASPWPGWPDWPWTARIRILFVTDGRITDGSGSDEFGLGLVLDTLRDISFAYWVRFVVTVVKRDAGFRFTDAGFDIDHYDQIWFFGDWPGLDANDPTLPDGRIEDDGYEHMESAELAKIAAWMNGGGGVFATGDHALLGASMCHKIPRVRSMRKWTHAQGVPSFADADRHETLQGRPFIGAYAAEGDRYPQRIYPVFRTDSDWPFIFGQWPHRLLCGKDGVIDEFPDHMHEGGVVEDDDVVVTDKLLPESAADEYPIVPIVVGSGVAAGPPVGDGPTLGRRPRPEVIAHGMTTNLESARTRFALIGVYDGDPGRARDPEGERNQPNPPGPRLIQPTQARLDPATAGRRSAVPAFWGRSRGLPASEREACTQDQWRRVVANDGSVAAFSRRGVGPRARDPRGGRGGRRARPGRQSNRRGRSAGRIRVAVT